MQIRLLDSNIEALLVGPDETPRSEGIHVSQIYRDIEHSLNGNRPPDADLSKAEIARLGNYRALGFAWERTLERSLVEAFASGAVVRPGEQEMDGIYLSPDLYNIEDGCLEEWKCTWRSMNKSNTPDELEHHFRVWFWQMKAYCRALETTEARLRVFFVNGNYKDSGPQTRVWHLSFTQQEIEDNWAMLRGHAKKRGWI